MEKYKPVVTSVSSGDRRLSCVAAKVDRVEADALYAEAEARKTTASRLIRELVRRELVASGRLPDAMT